jgi:hypothetical protein
MDRNSDFTQLKRGYLFQEREFGEEAIQNACPCIEFENTYTLYTKEDKKNQVVSGREISNVACRWCCGPARALEMPWTKGNDTKFTTEKPFRCFRLFNCTPLCLGRVDTHHRNARLGYVREDWCSCTTPSYTLYNEKNIPYARIRGPSACFGGFFENCQSATFRLEELNGRILTNLVEKKRLNGVSFEEVALNTLGDSDEYNLVFPDGATDEEKANMISALVLLDYMLFEGDKSSLQGGCYLGTFYCCGCVCPITCNPNNNNNLDIDTGAKTYDF